jgi:hypothetical protein
MSLSRGVILNAYLGHYINGITNNTFTNTTFDTFLTTAALGKFV